jgi:hypothetical protein
MLPEQAAGWVVPHNIFVAAGRGFKLSRYQPGEVCKPPFEGANISAGYATAAPNRGNRAAYPGSIG